MANRKPLVVLGTNLNGELTSSDTLDASVKLEPGSVVIGAPSPNGGAYGRSASLLATFVVNGSGAIVFKCGEIPTGNRYHFLNIFGGIGTDVDLNFNYISSTGSSSIRRYWNKAGPLPTAPRYALTPDGHPCVIFGSESSSLLPGVYTLSGVIGDSNGANDVTDDSCKNWEASLVTDLTGYTNVSSMAEQTISAAVATAQNLLVGLNLTIGNKFVSGYGSTGNTAAFFTPVDIGVDGGEGTVTSSSGSTVIDLSGGYAQYDTTLTEDTTISFTNLPSGTTGHNFAVFCVRITQNSTTAKTCSFSGFTVRTAGGVAWSPSSVLSSVEDVYVKVDSTGNVTLYPSGVLV